MCSVDMEDVILLKNHEWEVGMSEETNTLWETGVPGTTGWVQFASPRTLGLPTGLPSFDPDRPDDEVFIVTWGHQHHCLVSIDSYLILTSDLCYRKFLERPSGNWYMTTARLMD